MKNILILGASGSIGNFIYNNFKKDINYDVIGTSSKESDIFLFVNNDNLEKLLELNNLDIIVWCQGYNFNDNIFNFNEDEYLKIMNINVLFIIKTLNYLLSNNKVNENCKMVIISSIWEKFARNNKLSLFTNK